MKARTYTPEQIIKKLREGEELLASGFTLEETTKNLGIAKSTWHRWKSEYHGMDESQAKKLRDLEKENARLKKLVADQALDIDMLKEVSRGKF